MFPLVQEPIERFIKSKDSTIKEPRKRWHPQSQLLQVDPPQPTIASPDGKLIKRKYCSVKFKYRDGHDSKIKSKTVFFGDADGQYVGDHNEERRAKRFIRLHHQQDPFHPNYWRLQLLNTQSTIQEAYITFVRKVIGLRRPISQTTEAKKK